MVLRHKLTARAGALGCLLVSLWWLVDQRSPQALVAVAMAVVAVAASLRGLIVVRDGALYRRRLFGWDGAPFLLEEITAMSLRRELQGRYFPLVLRLGGRGGFTLVLECWAWARWRDLAHIAGHFADQLGVRLDEVTAGRVMCRRMRCEWSGRAADLVGGRRADPPDAPRLTLLDAVRTVVLLFGFGFALALFSVWMRTDLDDAPAVTVAFWCGAFFAVVGAVCMVWDHFKERWALDELSSDPFRHRR